MTINCILQKLGDVWWCPACDEDRKRLLPRKLRRNCRALGRFPVSDTERTEYDARGGATPEAVRQNIEAELQRRFDVDATKRTMPEMRATLDKCFGGCGHFDVTTCILHGSECRYRENWLLSIAAADCEAG